MDIGIRSHLKFNSKIKWSLSVLILNMKIIIILGGWMKMSVNNSIYDMCQAGSWHPIDTKWQPVYSV